MAIEEKIYVDDDGTHLEVEIQEAGAALDISTATAMKIKLLVPETPEKLVEYDAEFVNAGADGLIEIISVGDGKADPTFTIDGQWGIQGWVRMPDGAWHSTEDVFDVYPQMGS